MKKLPKKLRPILRRPLGELLSNMAGVVGRLRQKRPVMLISVGDVVTAGLLNEGISPDIAVVDYKVMRSPISEDLKLVIDQYKIPKVKVRNPAGTITPYLQAAIGKSPPLKIIVEGEEDLAALVAVMVAPIGSIVIYGQPGEGIVLIEVTEQKKQEFNELFDRFE